MISELSLRLCASEARDLLDVTLGLLGDLAAIEEGLAAMPVEAAVLLANTPRSLRNMRAGLVGLRRSYGRLLLASTAAGPSPIARPAAS